MDVMDTIKDLAQIEVGQKRIHMGDGSDHRAVTFTVTLFAPFDSYTGLEQTWADARIDDLLAEHGAAPVSPSREAEAL